MAVDTPSAAVPTRDSHPGARRWTLARLALAITYLLGGVAHLVLAATSLEFYESFADVALLGAYTDLWGEFVVPNLAVLVPLVALFELALGVALLWRGPAVRLAHAGGAGFQAALVLSGPWGPVNAVLAGIHAVAARRAYPTTVAGRLRAWRTA